MNEPVLYNLIFLGYYSRKHPFVNSFQHFVSKYDTTNEQQLRYDYCSFILNEQMNRDWDSSIITLFIYNDNECGLDHEELKHNRILISELVNLETELRDPKIMFDSLSKIFRPWRGARYENRDRDLYKTEYDSSVLRPAYYSEDRKYEPRKVIYDWNLNFNLGNAVKYISRAGRKDPEKKKEDLEKAIQYIKFELEEMEDIKNE